MAQQQIQQHWEQHACMLNLHDASDGYASGGVYSSKNEGEPANVLLTSSLGPFSGIFKMTPDRAEEVAKHLMEAAAAARAADAELDAVQVAA